MLNAVEIVTSQTRRAVNGNVKTIGYSTVTFLVQCNFETLYLLSYATDFHTVFVILIFVMKVKIVFNKKTMSKKGPVLYSVFSIF